MNPRLRISHEALARFCRDHAVRQLALFGSAVREDFEETSDVDVLIDLRPDARVGLVTLQRMSDELAGIFGRPVDLVTRAGLNRHIRDEVLGQAEILYAE